MKLKDPMPSLDGATVILNGDVSREQLIGEKPTLIHFWSVSCTLCKKAMGSISEFRDNHKDELNVISIHMPRSEDDLNVEQIKEEAKEHGITQPIIVDNQLTVSDSFENKYMPAYYLFDKTGELRFFQAGGSRMQLLEKRLARILDEAEQDTE